MKRLIQKLNRPLMLFVVALAVLGGFLLWNRYGTEPNVGSEYAKIKWPASMRLSKSDHLSSQGDGEQFEAWTYDYTYDQQNDSVFHSQLRRSLEDAGYVIVGDGVPINAQNGAVQLQVDYGAGGRSTKDTQVKVTVRKLN